MLYNGSLINNGILTEDQTLALGELKSSLRNTLGERLLRFVLYGSRAKGDYDEESDVDVAIIVKGLTRELKNQILDKVAEIELKYLTPLSTLVLSQEDFELLKKRERRIVLDIEREGIPCMTEENKRENIKVSLDKASEMLLEANILFRNGLITGAVSRLYYYLLHNVRALLLTKGLEPKSHEGTLRLFSLHFIKEGVFEPKASHLFAKLMKYREEADYNPAYVFTKEDFVAFRKEAEYLAKMIKGFLIEKGYLH